MTDVPVGEQCGMRTTLQPATRNGGCFLDALELLHRRYTREQLQSTATITSTPMMSWCADLSWIPGCCCSINCQRTSLQPYKEWTNGGFFLDDAVELLDERHMGEQLRSTTCIVRGCGRQKVGAYVNLGAYYVVGIPAALCFAFVYHLGGTGLWFGIMCGVAMQMLLLLSITLRTSWEKEALKAKARVSIRLN